MEKSIFTQEYAIFLSHLRAARKGAGLTQEQVADRLGQTQSFVSKCERGERRIDVVELRAFCQAIGISFTDFIKELETAMQQKDYLLEYAIVQHLNAIQTWPKGCLWLRQDPGFPDAILSGMPDIQPGIEVKTWFPLSTEITARFRDSQNYFQANQVKVAVVCWMLENVIAGQPKIVDIWIGDAIDVAKARDSHYHNPPYYVVMEPEDTSKRTRNLQQTNCHGHIFQGTAKQLEAAISLVDSWGEGAKEYRPDRDYQIRIRQLTGNFPYRLYTNFAKMDRIVLPSLETFKTNVLRTLSADRTIQSWARAINSGNPTALQSLIDPSSPNPL